MLRCILPIAYVLICYLTSGGISVAYDYYYGDAKTPEFFGWIGYFLYSGLISIYCLGGLIVVIVYCWRYKVELLQLIVLGLVAGIMSAFSIVLFTRSVTFSSLIISVSLACLPSIAITLILGQICRGAKLESGI